MKFSVAAVTLALATAAVAAPGYNKHSPEEKSIENICGEATLRCCNKEISKSNSHNSENGGGILGSLLNGLSLDNIGIFDQCSSLTPKVPIIGAALGDFLNSNCDYTAACCQETESSANGLIAVSVPCVPINILS